MILVYARSVVLPDARDLACAARAARADGLEAREEQLLAALTLAHGLPALLDLFADSRFVQALEKVDLRALEIVPPPLAAGRVTALAFHDTARDRVELRFIDAANQTVARVRAKLAGAVATGESDVLIRRFSHGGKGPPGERGST